MSGAHLLAKQAKDEGWEVFGAAACLCHGNYRPNTDEVNQHKLNYGYHCSLYTVLESVLTHL